MITCLIDHTISQTFHRTTLFIVALLAILLNGCASVRRLERPLPVVSSVGTPDFKQATGSLLGATFLPGNHITTLNDGAEIFPAMLDEIRHAKHTINFETFIFRRGEIADKFVEALAERARSGVKVKMILDAVGSLGSSHYHKRLSEAGVQLEIYHPIWTTNFWRLTYRTHRKLLIIDGKIGFIGGVGIGDQWRVSSTNNDHWRDLHYRVEGPVVAQMQAAFGTNWFNQRHEVILGKEYFPALRAVGSAHSGVFYSAPYRRRYSMGLMYHLAIAGARNTLLIENPYFVPDAALTEALCAAARRGVKVQVIMAGKHIDFSPVRIASKKRWPRLIAAGVELYEFSGTMLHSKLLVVDDLFVSVGSANLDPRSLALNDEANLNVIDSRFAREQSRIFKLDLNRSKRVKLKGQRGSLNLDFPLRLLQAPFEAQL